MKIVRWKIITLINVIVVKVYGKYLKLKPWCMYFCYSLLSVLYPSFLLKINHIYVPTKSRQNQEPLLSACILPSTIFIFIPQKMSQKIEDAALFVIYRLIVKNILLFTDWLRRLLGKKPAQKTTKLQPIWF